MAENEQNVNVLARLAHLLGVPPRAITVAVATAEAREEAPDALIARRQALVARRRELAEAGEEAARALSERLRPIGERMTGLRERASELRRQLAEAEAEALGVEITHSAEHRARERAVRVLEGELRDSSCPRLSAFVRELQDELAALRLAGPTTYQTAPHPLTDLRKTFTNYPTLNLRLAALQQAIATAEALMLEALPGEEIEKRLATLRTALPELQVVVAA